MGPGHGWGPSGFSFIGRLIFGRVVPKQLVRWMTIGEKGAVMFKSAVVVVVLGISGTLCAQTPGAAAPLSPAELPGRGLAQHDFLYAGESHDRRIFFVRQGENGGS